MAFGSVVKGKWRFGGKKYAWGTFTNSSSAGGDITVPMKVVESMSLQHTGTSVVTTAPVVNETFPLKNGGVVTIVTATDKNGIWFAVGK